MDDDKPKTANTGAGHYYGEGSRIGTAPTSSFPMGSGIQKSNYTGSDMGDSLHDDRNQVPSLGLGQNSTFGQGGIPTMNIGREKRYIGGGGAGGSQTSQRSMSDNRSVGIPPQ